MLLAGRALDRWGLWLSGPLLLALGVAGMLITLTAGRGLLALSIGLLVVGATSGAADVAINSLAGRAEQATGRPVITPAHATFSAVVVLATLTTGVLSALGAPLVLPFGLVAVAATATCVTVVRTLRAQPATVIRSSSSTTSRIRRDGTMSVRCRPRCRGARGQPRPGGSGLAAAPAWRDRPDHRRPSRTT